MQQFLATIVSFLIAAHTVLGCCTHHAHSPSSEVTAKTSCNRQGPSGCSRHSSHASQHQGDQHQGNSHHGNHHHGCHDGKCHFARFDVQHLDIVQLMLVALIPMLPEQAIAAQGEANEGFFWTVDDFQPPVPLYLQHQILLI